MLSWCVAFAIFWGPFLESPDNVSRPKSAFMFTVFALLKIKVSIILKKTKWNHQLTKQNWPVYELGTLLLFNCFWFRNLPSDPRSCRDVRETGPYIVCFEAVARGRFKQSITPRSRNYTSITTFLNDLSGIHIFHLTTYDSLSFPLFSLDIIW